MSDICDNLKKVKEEIEEARKYSLTGEKVQLIAVTKTHEIDTIKEAIACGVDHIGENKVQEFTSKMEVLKSKVNYHMIGNLQTNKVKYIYQDVNLIHSLDRKSLAKEIQKRASSSEMVVKCLVQVNIGREETKGGLLLEEVIPFVESILDYKNIKIEGLMTIAPNVDDEKYLRACFKKMISLKEEIEHHKYESVDMNILSMGMSQDFRIAIEEGANMVRVGSRIFGQRDYSK